MDCKYFLPFHSVVSFINSILKQDAKAQSWEVTGPGHTAGEGQDWELDLVTLEPGCFTTRTPCLADALLLLVFMIPH